MEDNHFTCSSKDCNLRFSSEDTFKLHKKRHEMVLSLSKSNIPASDQTPTPVRFIRQCEEIGLFQDLQNVNPFEETFRKAAEAVKKGSIPKQQNVSILSRVSDDLHTPHIFPEEIITETNNEGNSETVEEVVVRTEADTSLRANSTTQHLSPPVSNDRVSTTVSVSDPIRDRGILLDPVTHDNLARVSSTPTFTTSAVSDTVFPATSSATDPVQVLLRMPNGSIVQLATKPITTPIVPVNIVTPQLQLDEPVKVLPKTCTNGGTVILATQDFQKVTQSPSSEQIAKVDVKQKLKQLLGGTSKVTKPASTLQKIASPAVKSGVGSAKKVSNINGECSKDESESEKRRQILERNRKAAIRCRERRKRWVEELRKKADSMAVTNRALTDEIRVLKAEVANLRTLLLAHANCPVTLAQASISENVTIVNNERTELGSKRARRDGLTLNIEQATRASIVPTIELDTPTPTIVRSDKVLSSVAPPATPEQDRLVSFTDILPHERTSEINEEIVEERHLTASASLSGGSTTTVIQINPNAIRPSHTFS
ncbi:hypothetical protein O3M35_010404 [Rhynocoris fuscipes]|uniref:Cyclic AMP-dependent transcription factor ATF-2 n=1 Tax=Rhynocoris fuscipes TaxID=488301 RepID=A0AAW1D1Y3_9HEMI